MLGIAGHVGYLLAGPDVLPRLRIALGPRDDQPALSPLGGRAQRALDNLHEALPVFLTLALLHVLLRTPGSLAVQGAVVFFLARLLYVPTYLAGIPGLRSAIWLGSWAGLAMMIAALVAQPGEGPG